ncbi:alpha-ketoglutarate-dependent dioxygenase AlkB family protein [Salegentibacter chungangensis]|uniref:Alpha-ketoglutarate-dependent dioxygenase AlkB family protein n=1 Tax=Salegentibacter chungangensis TaxID=1335724 RepID=A0ABW3NR42_9FLAO
MQEEKIILPDSDLIYYRDFLVEKEAQQFLKIFIEEFPWRQDKIKLFGKEHLQPRLTALFADNAKPYTYSGITMQPDEFPEPLLKIKHRAEEVCGTKFTTCLANLYRDGQDSMGWHADDEKELGKNPVIASVSLGAERMFHLKHKQEKSLKHKLRLENGSLFLMQGLTQHFWKHQIPKTKKVTAPRINLTFRKIK